MGYSKDQSYLHTSNIFLQGYDYGKLSLCIMEDRFTCLQAILLLFLTYLFIKIIIINLFKDIA